MVPPATSSLSAMRALVTTNSRDIAVVSVAPGPLWFSSPPPGVGQLSTLSPES
jgi:hypothetical protein